MSVNLTVISNAFNDGDPIPEKYAFCAACPDNHTKMSTNISPQISWSGAPDETRSFTIMCVDVDVPTIFDDINTEGKTIPAHQPRQNFYHSLLVDIPVNRTSLEEGEESDGLVAKGKPTGRVAYGIRGTNDFTMFMASNPEMAGSYGGYDGPCPPWNDELIHRYEFRVYALDVETLGLAESGEFKGADVIAAMKEHILAQGTLVGTYTQNPDIASSG